MAEGQHRHQYVVTMQMTVTCSTSLQLPRHRELKWRLCPAILTKGENTEMVPFNQVPLLTEHVLVTQLYLTFCDPWTVPCQTPLSMGFSRQEYWSHSLLQGIFLTQGSNPCLLHRKQILYCLSHQGSLSFLPEKATAPFSKSVIKKKPTDEVCWINFIPFLQFSTSFFQSGENLNAYLSDKDFFFPFYSPEPMFPAMCSDGNCDLNSYQQCHIKTKRCERMQKRRKGNNSLTNNSNNSSLKPPKFLLQRKCQSC